MSSSSCVQEKPLLLNSDSHSPRAATILRDVLLRWSTPVNQLKEQTHQALREYLAKPLTPASVTSHEGALRALLSLGPQVLEENLLPLLDNYVNRLDQLEKQDEGAVDDDRLSSQLWLRCLNQIRGTLALAAALMVRRRSDLMSRTEAGLFEDAFSCISNHFGDSLLSTVTLENKASVTVPPKEVVGRLKFRFLGKHSAEDDHQKR